MDSGEVVAVNGDSDVVPVLSLDKENEKVDNGIEILQVTEDVPNSTEVEVDTVSTVSETKSPNPSKKLGAVRGDALKNGTTPKDQKGNKKGPTVIAQKKTPSLSQSFSFPSRGGMAKANGLKKSLDGKPGKHGTEGNGTEPKASVYARLSHPTRRVSTGATPVEAKSSADGVTARRATLASLPSTRQSVAKKYGAVKASVNGPASDVSQSHDQSSNPARLSLPTKDDDDARSATSSTTPRGSRRSSGGSGFAFRLDERAEKRKEFYSKIEEKIHAKEVEKNNLQAKSKESQEAAIKQLRKKLTFKATPMPTFYKEPPPPKTELKKIPSTRPISPKLGRHKTSVAVPESSIDGTGSCQSPVSSSSPNPSKFTGRGAQVNSNGDAVASKKTFGRSLSKLPSQKSATTKTEAKLPSAKPKTRDSELETQRADDAEVKTLSKSTDVLPQESEPTEFEADKDLIEKTESISVSQEIEPVEVSADKDLPEDVETSDDAAELVTHSEEIPIGN